MRDKLESLLSADALALWDGLAAQIDALYDVDRLWNKGFGQWTVEYKYRRGGKTLCTFYAKEGEANLLITYGAAEREKFEGIKASLSPSIQEIYDSTETLHDGKWLWFPIDKELSADDVIAMLKIKRRPNRK